MDKWDLLIFETLGFEEDDATLEVNLDDLQRLVRAVLDAAAQIAVTHEHHVMRAVFSSVDRNHADEQALAEKEALERGLSFLVHGVWVSADHVQVVSTDALTGPIADMRREKDEARAELAQLRDARMHTAMPLAMQAIADVVSLLRVAYDSLGSNSTFARSEARYAIGQFIDNLPMGDGS